MGSFRYYTADFVFERIYDSNWSDCWMFAGITAFKSATLELYGGHI